MNVKHPLLIRAFTGIGLILLALLSALPMIPPRAVPIDAPSNRFSAERAMSDLQVIAREPHAAMSPAQKKVRDYIVSQAALIGVPAEIQAGSGIENILVRVRGKSTTQTVLITGHYDSHPPAPGAGDNGITVAAMLEALRVLRAGPALSNDLLFLFTDGEELGWFGANTFILKYPEVKKEIGLVLCFDALPGNGPIILKQTSPGDAWLAGQLARVSMPIFGGSWTNPDERTDQDTDFEAFAAAGFTGVEIENESTGTRYHTDRDTVAAISPAVVQSFGETMLALANHFGGVNLNSKTAGPDQIYFSLPLLGLAVYPNWLMPALSCAGILILAVLIGVAWRRSLFSLWRFLLSLLGLLLGNVLLVGGAQFAWGFIQKSHADEVSLYGFFEGDTAWITAVMLVTGLLMVVILSLLSRHLGGVNLAFAASVFYLLVWTLAYYLADAANPLTTAYIAWPFLGSVAGIAVMLFAKRGVLKLALLVVAAEIVMSLMVPTLMLEALSPEQAWISVLIIGVVLGLLTPQLEIIFGRSLVKAGQIVNQPMVELPLSPNPRRV